MGLQKSEWKGYPRYDFQVNGHDCLLIAPKEAAAGKPWVWRAEFFDAFAYADMALLAEGWHIAYCDLHDRFGSPGAVREMKAFHDALVLEMGLSGQADLFGFSRGGLYAVNYTAAYPADVAVLYLDAPVQDLRSWPLGAGKGVGSPRDTELCLAEFGVTDIAEIRDMPVNNIPRLNGAGVPILLVYGDADEVVPYAENGAVLAAGFTGEIKIIPKPGVGHHPHSLEPPTAIVEFIKAHH